ncbi:MAG: hypothetical protein KDI06_01440 [Calditrichaeota bacterium]|nr:hypothetical protein [Calditrichota bacterium]
MRTYLERLGQRQVLWIPVGVLAFFLKLPLVLLPAAGRDEAVYAYWANHPEWAYAPLLHQWVKLNTWLGLPDLLALRLPAILPGLLLLWLTERILARQNRDPIRRLALLLAVALSPWQIYAGSILHPDNLMLFLMVAAVLGACQKNLYRTAFFAALAFWAKPAGILALAGLGGWLIGQPGPRSQKGLALTFALLMVLPVILAFSPEMIAAIAEFGKMPAARPWWSNLGLFLASLGLLAGPALLALAPRLKRAEIPIQLREQSLAWWLALAYLGGFLLAAATRGQIKGNWLLPGLLMLILATPHSRPLMRRWPLWTSLSLLFSLLLVIGMSNPALPRYFERTFPEWAQSYGAQAGQREARVSATASWSARVGEYQSAAPFFRAVLQAWRERHGSENFPPWVLGDDYGLTAQMLRAWGAEQVRMIIPEDGVFWRESAGFAPGSGNHGLLLGVRMREDELWPEAGEIIFMLELPHPQTGDPVRIGVGKGR